jgi:hypothetical protein
LTTCNWSIHITCQTWPSGSVKLEVALALSCVGTAVVLFPVARRQSETAALGFVAARVLEAGLILVGVVSLLSVVTLRHDPRRWCRPDPASLVTARHTLTAAYDWTFLLGQSLMPVFNALCLGSVMYRSGLVPRIIPAIGLVGAPLQLAWHAQPPREVWQCCPRTATAGSPDSPRLRARKAASPSRPQERYKQPWPSRVVNGDLGCIIGDGE